MCGICGVVDYRADNNLEEDTLRRMCRKMQHRGPDDEGIYIKNNRLSVGLGHRRLSIIDLSAAGHQPIPNEDNSLWLVLNGEIYNFQKLRQDLEDKGHRFRSNTDAEVVLHLYEDYAEDCLAYLRGMFAFAIWDERQDKLFLARDRVGKKPLIYYYDSQYFCFASEFTALLACGLIEKKINRSMINPYLTFGYIPAPYSIYEGIYKLPPAHFAVFKNNKLTLTRYWSLDYTHKLSINEKEATGELKRIMFEAVKLRLESDVPLGVFLSGGLDSSMVVALMAKLGRKVKTFSIGFAEESYNELHYARKVASRYQTEHHELIITPKIAQIIPLLVEHYGEPYADSSAIPSYCVAREAKRFVTVALNGDGGDESFAGYERYQAMYLAQYYCQLPRLLREKILNKIFTNFPDSIHFHSWSRKVRRFFEGTRLPWLERYRRWVSMLSQDLVNEIYSEKFKNIFRSDDTLAYLSQYLTSTPQEGLLDRLLHTDISTNLPNDLLVKMDIACMANSLECRSPFLDQEFMQFMASLPIRFRFKWLVKKYLLKKIAKEYLPKDVIYRPKRGFGVPVGYWFRQELKDFISNHLLSPKFFKRGYFNRTAVENLIKLHLEGKADYTFQIWTLLMFELWHQKFID